ncbi:hypothetical protein LCGC14_0144610 [marine sediment metagenome]|uniref:SDR family oxidoreductase n=3 Tax=root TaxID=1 RepID=A0A7V1BRH4_9GAMM|nr:SDR family oxidoreductase [Marinobacter antarcticus]HDZ58028.1 SDR family oxidoreductase [Halopseudomonas xinjiangensis]HEA51019.1 SDR family oxidoreductase [Marinobacter antarcticus]
MKVLVTGASGFIGGAVCTEFLKRGFETVAASRHGERLPSGAEHSACGNIDGETDWTCALMGVHKIVHLAARAHVIKESAADPLAVFRRVNVDGSLALARQAIKSGVNRFIFISSIGVNGASTAGGPFTEDSQPEPQADYAMSKFEAEQALIELVHGSAMELVIIRPPLVYAGHAPGNFQRLMRLVACGIPLPFAKINNRRSMVSLVNLVDFIRVCLEHPDASGQILLASDGVAVSTEEIVCLLAKGMGKTPRLFPFPTSILANIAAVLGKKNMYSQVCGSLEVDSSKAHRLLGWSPPITVQESLVQAGKDFKNIRFG